MWATVLSPDLLIAKLQGLSFYAAPWPETEGDATSFTAAPSLRAGGADLVLTA